MLSMVMAVTMRGYCIRCHRKLILPLSKSQATLSTTVEAMRLLRLQLLVLPLPLPLLHTMLPCHPSRPLLRACSIAVLIDFTFSSYSHSYLASVADTIITRSTNTDIIVGISSSIRSRMNLMMTHIPMLPSTIRHILSSLTRMLPPTCLLSLSFLPFLCQQRGRHRCHCHHWLVRHGQHWLTYWVRHHNKWQMTSMQSLTLSHNGSKQKRTQLLQ